MTIRRQRQRSQVARSAVHNGLKACLILVDIRNGNRAACKELIRYHRQIFGHGSHGQIANYGHIVDTKDRDLFDLFGTIKAFDGEGFNLGISNTQILHGSVCNTVGVVAVRCQHQCAQITCGAGNNRLKHGLVLINIYDR